MQSNVRFSVLVLLCGFEQILGSHYLCPLCASGFINCEQWVTVSENEERLMLPKYIIAYSFAPKIVWLNFIWSSICEIII